MKLLTHGFRKLTDSFLDALFPETCLVCNSRGRIICQVCAEKLPRAEKGVEKDILACFDYQNPTIKKAIWKLKYSARSSIGETLGAYIHNVHLQEISDIQVAAHGSAIIVIPIPLSKSRKKKRAYNQAEKIAVGFVNNAPPGIFILKNNIVEKQKETIPQATILEKTKRLKNVVGAFSLSRTADVRGRSIIVMDDVTTTGATMKEVIAVLKKNGAKNVIGVAFAH